MGNEAQSLAAFEGVHDTGDFDGRVVAQGFRHAIDMCRIPELDPSTASPFARLAQIVQDCAMTMLMCVGAHAKREPSTTELFDGPPGARPRRPPGHARRFDPLGPTLVRHHEHAHREFTSECLKLGDTAVQLGGPFASDAAGRRQRLQPTIEVGERPHGAGVDVGWSARSDVARVPPARAHRAPLAGARPAGLAHLDGKLDVSGGAGRPPPPNRPRKGALPAGSS